MGHAIEVRGVSKKFRIDHERKDSLKERVVTFGRRRPHEDFWALQDITFDVDEGETVGLLGHNGSGKSTLLKCIGGILQPTSGEILTRGRLASLLELGAGFHPDLTGRENVFLNASILGLSRKQIEQRLDEIVAFAELEQFIDQQVKHYSSGMYIRLGFAVATNVDPDVLLVDEVLAVGDEAFQRKCLQRVRQFQKEGRTIIFVTHAADLVREVCDRAVVLDHGKTITIGTPGHAIRTFRDALMNRGEPVYAELDLGTDDTGDIPVVVEEVTKPGSVRIVQCVIEGPGMSERGEEYLLPGEPMRIHIEYDAPERVDDVVFAINIHDVEGKLVYGANTDFLGGEPDGVEGRGWVTFDFSSMPLFDGTFIVSLGIHSHDIGTLYDQRDGAWQFQVMNPTRLVGLVALDAKITFDPPPGA